MDMVDFELAAMQPKIMAFAVAVNPEPWAIGEISVVRNKQSGKYIPVVAPNANLKTYQEAVRSELMAAGVSLKLPKYSIRFTFGRVNATYTSASGRTAHRNAPDVTNMQKATEDALQGVLIGNDRDVIHIESLLNEIPEGESQGYVIIEVLYGLVGPGDTRFPNGLTTQALSAFINMTQRIEGQLRIQDNEWKPGDD